MDKAFFKLVIRFGVAIVMAIVLCKVTNGVAGALLALWGLCMAIQNKMGYALCCYVFFPFLVIMNPFLLPKTPIMIVTLRLTPLIMGVVLAVVASRRPGKQRLPLGMLVVFLGCALISSMQGYCPPVSYLKIINFSVFIAGLWYGTQNIHRAPNEVRVLRAYFTAMSFFVIFGSLCTLPFPAIAYPLNTRMILMSGLTVDDAAAILAKTEAMRLFSGVTGHSQCLAPITVCCFGWLLCDMLFVLQKTSRLHLLAFACVPVILYLSRSRLGLISFVLTIAIVFGYAGKINRLSLRVIRNVRKLAWLFLVLLVILGVGSEVQSRALTRWVRKTDSLETDKRTAKEAFTNSRMGLIEDNLRDWEYNRLLGSGFQVTQSIAEMYNHSEGFIISATLEKGVLPVMVLGETGVLGAVVFAVFVLTFCATCMSKRYIVTLSLFLVLLVTNLGEATFFSPGGLGGILWIFSVGGGFVIDSMVLYGRNMRRQVGLRQLEMQQGRVYGRC